MTNDPVKVRLLAWCPKCGIYSCGCKGVGVTKTVKEIMGEKR